MMTILLLSIAAAVALAAVRMFVLPYLVMGPQALDQFNTFPEYRFASWALGLGLLALVALPFSQPALMGFGGPVHMV